jgi:hypothetical protein
MKAAETQLKTAVSGIGQLMSKMSTAVAKVAASIDTADRSITMAGGGKKRSTRRNRSQSRKARRGASRRNRH